MKRIYVANPDNIFYGKDEQFISYPARQKPPYQAWLIVPDHPDEDKGKVYFQVDGPGPGETNIKEFLIELMDLRTKMEDRQNGHLNIIIPPSGIEGLSIGTKISHPKVGELQKLWNGSPYSFVQTLVAVEEKMIAEKFIHTPIIAEAFNLKEMDARIKWKDFYEKYKQFFLR